MNFNFLPYTITLFTLITTNSDFILYDNFLNAVYDELYFSL